MLFLGSDTITTGNNRMLFPSCKRNRHVKTEIYELFMFEEAICIFPLPANITRTVQAIHGDTFKAGGLIT